MPVKNIMASGTNIVYFDEMEPMPAYAQPQGILSYWLGRSCGCRLGKVPPIVPVAEAGIVVYEGQHYEEGVVNNTEVKHVQTKNGPLTILMKQ